MQFYYTLRKDGKKIKRNKLLRFRERTGADPNL